MRTIVSAPDGRSVKVIDQTKLPGELAWVTLSTVDQMADAIGAMVVRGAPLIGVAGAWGVAFGLHSDASDAALAAVCSKLVATRPTAVNLRRAVDLVRGAIQQLPPTERARAAVAAAEALTAAEVDACRAIGEAGLPLLQAAWDHKGRQGRLNVLTHCNAGWLATVEHGTALAPIFLAHDRGLPVHVWVDETRPRNQGLLTAWELRQHGVPHTVVADNAGGHLMQRGQVDLCIVGTDRTTAVGDVCNKIGTWLKALAARHAGVPFYVAAPSSSVDFTLQDWRQIPIEERSGDEVRFLSGVQLVPAGSPVANPAFDVTPASHVTALITEYGVFPATAVGLGDLRARVEGAA